MPKIDEKHGRLYFQYRTETMRQGIHFIIPIVLQMSWRKVVGGNYLTVPSQRLEKAVLLAKKDPLGIYGSLLLGTM